MTYVQWGRSDSCSNGHTTLYSGYAMGERSDLDAQGGSAHNGVEMLCMNSELAVHATSSTTNDDGQLFFPTEFAAGSADETLYPAGQEVGCSLCAV